MPEPCHPERNRIRREAHDPAKSKDPYLLHSAWAEGRDFSRATRHTKHTRFSAC